MKLTAEIRPVPGGYRLVVAGYGLENPANLHLVRSDPAKLDGFAIPTQEQAETLADQLQVMLDGQERRKQGKRMTAKEQALIAVKQAMARAREGSHQPSQ